MFSHEHLVGVKCRAIRWFCGQASQRRNFDHPAGILICRMVSGRISL